MRYLIIGSLVVLITCPLAVKGDLLWSEGAENGLNFVINGASASYPLIQSSVVGRGSNAFHLANPSFQDNWFVLDHAIAVQPDTKLFFLSQLRAATVSQVARVQISTDGGNSWGTNIYGQAGTGFPGEATFSLREVNLASQANQNLRFRFYYDHTGGSAFTGTTSQDGWFVDDIQIGSAFEKIPYSIGNPSSHAQQYLEYVNRARANALVEATRLANSTNPDITSAYSFFGVTGANIVSQFNSYVQSGCMAQFAQPLAFNEKLLQASELHTLDLFNNQFQGHVSSSNPPSPFQPGDSLGTRLNRVGYSFSAAAENVFSYADSVEQGHAGFDVDWGNSSSPASACYNAGFVGQGMQNPAGHRRNIHNDSYKEIGIGVINGTNGSVGPQLVTQDLGSQGAATFVTGVVYQDLNGNNFYDLGEGRGGVRVDVSGSPYYAVSTASGGYTVPVNGDGSYQVTFSGGGFLNFVTGASVTGGKNVKVDYLAVPGLLGDYTGNLVVDAADYTVWRDLRGSTGLGLAADGNRDSTVNDLDYQIWVDHFGEVMGGGMSILIPEPASGSSLLTATAAAIVLNRKRRQYNS